MSNQSNSNQSNHHQHHIKIFKQKFIVSLILSIPILVLSSTIQDWFGYSLQLPYNKYILLLLSTIIYLYGGSPFLKGLYGEVKKLQPGMMTLIGSAISVAFFYSAATVFFDFGNDFFWELATLVDVMLLGHWIEAKSLMGASQAVEELVKIMPQEAHRITNGNTEVVKVADLKKDDKVLVKPGEKIPSDGIIYEGESSVNEAMLTGESKPIPKKENDKVLGGSINTEGTLKIKIEKTGDETYLSQVIELVKKSQESKSRTQDLANRAAALLFYVAVGSGIITYIVWALLGDSFFGFKRTVTVLVISCPHALGLAIPLVVALSTSITAKMGILIRNRPAFELSKNINAIVFDKTGTLTEGKFGVDEVISFMDEGELITYAAAIENNSEHTIAQAIVEYAKQNETDILETTDFKAIPGKGAYAKIQDKEVHAGSPALMNEMGIDISDDQIKKQQDQGKTVVFIVINKQLAGAIALSDIIKKESKEAIRKLKELNIKTYMITGDAQPVADAVARELGIDEYFAEVLPDKKVEKINKLQEEGYKVAMVGDGINDAPALAGADVGIAIGAGTDVAMESADIVLVKSNPIDVMNLIFMSKKTYSKMIQNLWWAAGYNIIAIPLAAGVLYFAGIIISPAVGAILMSVSTVIVAINTQTLRKYMPEGS
jgi:Cu2+-exporting ATPase